MPIQMLNKIKKTSAIFCDMATAAMVILPAALPLGSTDNLQYRGVASMTNNGVEIRAHGTVKASQKVRGLANNQSLSVIASDLATNTTYDLVVAFSGGTNMLDIGSFTTDRKGKLGFEYRSTSNNRNGGHNVLPDSLNPVSLIRAVGIVNSNAETVLTADLSVPDELQYQVKRYIQGSYITSSRAFLMIKADSSHTQFQLSSTGLFENQDYLLMFNDEVVQTNKSDSLGKIDINLVADMPPYILDVRSVKLSWMPPIHLNTGFIQTPYIDIIDEDLCQKQTKLNSH